METWTITKLLNWVRQFLTDKGIDSPRLSAELLLSHVLGLKRIELYTQYDTVVGRQESMPPHHAAMALKTPNLPTTFSDIMAW